MEFEILTADETSMLVFQAVTSCVLVGRNQRFGGTYYLHLQSFIHTALKLKKQRTTSGIVVSGN